MSQEKQKEWDDHGSDAGRRNRLAKQNLPTLSPILSSNNGGGGKNNRPFQWKWILILLPILAGGILWVGLPPSQQENVKNGRILEAIVWITKNFR